MALHCEPYWTAAYKCLQGCGPCPGGGGGPAYVPPQPTPEQQAFARAQPRYVAVLRLLSESLPFFAGAALMANLPSTPERLAQDADSLHKYLASLAASFNAQSAAYRDSLTIYQNLTPELTAQARAIRNVIPRLEAKAVEARGYIPWYQGQIDWLNARAQDLSSRSGGVLARVKRDQVTVEAAFAVLLPAGLNAPPGAASIVEPDPIKNTPMPRTPDIVLGDEMKSFPIPALPALPDTNAQPRPDAVAGLAGTLDDRVQRLEADAQAARYAFQARNDFMQQAQPRKSAYEAAVSDFSDALKRRTELAAEITDTTSRVERLHREDLAATDRARQEGGRFLLYASQALIWRNAKMVALNALKVELKTNHYFKTHTDLARSPFLDVSEADILKFYNERKFNVMNLPDAFETGLELNKVRNSIVTLQTHAEGYASVAATLAAYGSETETKEFVDGIFAGMDKDSRQIVSGAMNTMNVPEPFSTMFTSYFLRPLQ
jgi:hypothetical protein